MAVTQPEKVSLFMRFKFSTQNFPAKPTELEVIKEPRPANAEAILLLSFRAEPYGAGV
jgi:hypothetical protein